jgi:hypothetical protein
LLLDHAVKVLKRLGGFADMLEDAIERARQRQSLIEERLIRLRSDTQKKKSQAKFENAALMHDVIQCQNNVRGKRKRKMKSMPSDQTEPTREEQKKMQCTEKRDNTVEWAKRGDLAGSKLPVPRVYV